MPELNQYSVTGSTAPLFAPREIEPPARRTAVAETSRAAWDVAKRKLNEKHMLILRHLAAHGPCVFEAIHLANPHDLPLSSSGRMGDLVDGGMVEVIGEGRTSGGNRAKLCRITDQGRKAIND